MSKVIHIGVASFLTYMTFISKPGTTLFSLHPFCMALASSSPPKMKVGPLVTLLFASMAAASESQPESRMVHSVGNEEEGLLFDPTVVLASLKPKNKMEEEQKDERKKEEEEEEQRQKEPEEGLERITINEILVPRKRVSVPEVCLPFIETCPVNTVQANDRCYRYVELPLKWLDAKRDCEAQGGFLAKPDFAYNDTALDLSATYRTIIGRTFIWIGATDMNSTLVWQWSDGSSLSTRDPNWFPGHPGNDNCATIYQMKRGRLQMYKHSCAARRNFLCQFEPLKGVAARPSTPRGEATSYLRVSEGNHA